MSIEKEILKRERLFARDITRIFERAISGLNLSHPVNLRKVVARTTAKNTIHKATERVYKLGKGHARKDIDSALKLASAAKVFSGEIEDGVTLGPFEDKLVNEYTKESVAYMDYLAKDTQNKMNTALQIGYTMGDSIPELSKRVSDVWGVSKSKATRFARTQTNSIYNAAHLNTYKSEPFIESVQFVAKLDSRTSPVCRLYDGTIWKLTDSGIKTPPLHFNCRSRLVAYPYTYPGDRDFTKLSDGTKVSYSEISIVQKQLKTFKTKYHKDLVTNVLKPATRAGATFTAEEINFMDYKMYGTEDMQESTLERLYGRVLTKDEIAAVDAYTGNQYRVINSYLTTGNAGSDEMNERAIKYIKRIDAGLTKTKLEKDFVLHRGISTEVADEMLKTGKMQYAGYSSTSEDIKTARFFSVMNTDGTSKYKDVLIFKTQKGTKGIHIGGEESEIILDKGLKLEVTHVQTVEQMKYLESDGRAPDSFRLIYCNVI